MTLDQEHHGDILVLRPIGRLDSSSSTEAERVVTEQIDAGAKRLIFDLSSLDYISSAGLRVILLAGKKLRTTHGKLVLVGVHGLIREVFDMSGFLSLFAEAPSLEEGLAKV